MREGNLAMRALSRSLTLGMIVGASLFSTSSRAADVREVAIIVHKENPTEGVSLKELTKIFRQEKQFWDDGRKIYLIMREAGAVEKDVVLKKIYEMDDQALKKFWLGKIFKGETPSFPTTVGSNATAKQLVTQAPSAIGFINASLVDDSVKPLRIDGKLPGEQGYVLSTRSQ